MGVSHGNFFRYRSANGAVACLIRGIEDGWLIHGGPTVARDEAAEAVAGRWGQVTGHAPPHDGASESASRRAAHDYPGP